ncbi:hypothetical protein K438DRAFT_1506817, partial [Mycena galopus ATCC 62051]
KKVLADGNMGAEWAELVEAWWGLEESWNFASSVSIFGSQRRFAVVAAWVKSARKGVPDIGKAEEMETQWWAWWTGINPSWRRREGVLVQVGEGSWDVLRCPRQNGFLSVLACLKW